MEETALKEQFGSQLLITSRSKLWNLRPAEASFGDRGYITELIHSSSEDKAKVMTLGSSSLKQHAGIFSYLALFFFF